MTQPRNIVFILADQLGASALSCYGGGVPSTPALDRLAASGTRFTRHYCVHPSCSPSRASYLTGRSAAVHGVVDNNYVLDPCLPTYADVLAAHDYRTAVFGKVHQTPMMLELPRRFDHLGFHDAVVTEDPKWGPWIDSIRDAHPQEYERALSLCWDPALRRLTGLERRMLERSRALYLLPRKEASSWRSMYESPLPAQLHDTAFITDRAIAFMADHLEHHADQPFLCHVSYVDPHDPYDPPAPYSTMFRPEDMLDPLPAEWLAEGLNVFADRSYIGFDEICDDLAVIREWRALYHGELRFMDDQIARIDAFLSSAGIQDNTILVFATDHGEMLGDHGLIAKHAPQYDAGIRCPLIVTGGGVARGVSDELVSTLDFFPTFCDWAAILEVDRPPTEGISFASTCQRRSRRARLEFPRRRALSVSGIGVETVVSDDNWRLSLFHRTGEGQLFDLTADPGEQDNLYHDSRHAMKRAELYERLVSEMARPRNTPDFRSLPLVGRRRCRLSAGLERSLPDYTAGRRPPEWPDRPRTIAGVVVDTTKEEHDDVDRS